MFGDNQISQGFNGGIAQNGLNVAPGYHMGPDGKIYDAQGNVVNDGTQQGLAGQPAGPPMSPSDQQGTAAMNGVQFAGQSPPEFNKLMQMHLGALNIGAMRPEQAQARTNAMDNQLSAFQPMNRVMQSMYGPQGGVDLNRLGQNPMGPSMLQTGQPNPVMGMGRPPPFQQTPPQPPSPIVPGGASGQQIAGGLAGAANGYQPTPTDPRTQALIQLLMSRGGGTGGFAGR